MNPLLLKVEQAAELLNLSRAKTYELIMAGDIPSIKLGASRRIVATDLEGWVAQQHHRQEDVA